MGTRYTFCSAPCKNPAKITKIIGKILLLYFGVITIPRKLNIDQYEITLDSIKTDTQNSINET